MPSSPSCAWLSEENPPLLAPAPGGLSGEGGAAGSCSKEAEAPGLVCRPLLESIQGAPEVFPWEDVVLREGGGVTRFMPAKRSTGLLASC